MCTMPYHLFRSTFTISYTRVLTSVRVRETMYHDICQPIDELIIFGSRVAPLHGILIDKLNRLVYTAWYYIISWLLLCSVSAYT